MKPEILDLLKRLEFIESQPGLWKKELLDQWHTVAYIDFRKKEHGDKGRRYAVYAPVPNKPEATDFVDDPDDVEILREFKIARDEILSGTKSPIIQDEHEKYEKSQLPQKAAGHLHLAAPPISGMVAPVATIDTAIEIFKKYEEAKTRILSENDILWIGDDGKPTAKGKGKPHIKRSGWRKLARFFGLSCEIINKEKITDGKDYKWIYRVVATHPSGAQQYAEGIASSRDKFFTKGGKTEAKEENVMLKAQTVAFNRAISDLLGGGEISAEEVEE